MERLTDKHYTGDGYYMKCSGRWDLLDDAGSKIVKWNCDRCNRISTSKTDYCPNCGAKMEE